MPGNGTVDGLLTKAQLKGVSPKVVKALAALAVVLIVFALIRWWPQTGDEGFSIDVAGAESQAVEGGELLDVGGGAEASEASVSVATCAVYIVGAVAAPGVYELAEGSRVADAVEAAGGLSPEADAAAINLARLVSDGEQITVPTVEETAAAAASGQASGGSSGGSASYSGDTGTSASSGLININSATAAELDTLPGIGEVTAAKIIAYRESNGGFSSKEEIKEVSGIGDAKYAQIESLICV